MSTKLYVIEQDREYINPDIYYDFEGEAKQLKFAIDGNKEYKSYTFAEYDLIKDKFADWIEAVNEIIEYPKESYYDTITEACNCLLPRPDHKSYNTKQIHKFKMIFNHACQHYTDDYRPYISTVLNLMLDKKYRNQSIRGCCQGEVNHIIYDPDNLTQQGINYIEAVYFGTGTEYLLFESEEDLTPEQANDLILDDKLGLLDYWFDYTELLPRDYKKMLAGSYNCDISDVKLFTICNTQYIKHYQYAAAV